MQLGKESLKKFSPAWIHTHTHNLLTTEIHEVSFPRKEQVLAEEGTRGRRSVQEYSSSQ